MNSAINYSGFVDLFLASDEDFEPYGAGSGMPGASRRLEPKGQHVSLTPDRAALAGTPLAHKHWNPTE